ncbi:hypothetical protein ECG_03305 [Echinococcus granulosus]|nr:hypothetical protein ECG_03305 [Echinococcus granulosus]
MWILVGAIVTSPALMAIFINTTASTGNAFVPATAAATVPTSSITASATVTNPAITPTTVTASATSPTTTTVTATNGFFIFILTLFHSTYATCTGLINLSIIFIFYYFHGSCISYEGKTGQ